jgi:quercetin dioxygenase-like cupin family protein
MDERTDDRCGGLSRRQLLALMTALGVPADALAQDAVQVDRRSYRVAFENDRVRVLEYRSRPGLGVCGQGVHSHPDHLTVLLTDAKAKVTLADGKVLMVRNKAGDVFWEPASTHSVENVGGSGARAYMVEIKDRNWTASTG